jgi:protein-tyrosine-phosphatase
MVDIHPIRITSVLFACTHNAIRSPMAEAILKHFYGRKLYVDSAGVREGEVDSFAVAAVAEIGIDLHRHRSKTFDQLQDSSFDLVISLSPEAQHKAVEMTRTMACDVEYWQTFDPSILDGSRDVRMAGYRQVRDALVKRIRTRFDGH